MCQKGTVCEYTRVASRQDGMEVKGMIDPVLVHDVGVMRRMV